MCSVHMGELVETVCMVIFLYEALVNTFDTLGLKPSMLQRGFIKPSLMAYTRSPELDPAEH